MNFNDFLKNDKDFKEKLESLYDNIDFKIKNTSYGINIYWTNNNKVELLTNTSNLDLFSVKASNGEYIYASDTLLDSEDKLRLSYVKSFIDEKKYQYNKEIFEQGIKEGKLLLKKINSKTYEEFSPNLN